MEFQQEYLNEFYDSGRENLHKLADKYVKSTEEFDAAHGGDEVWRPGGWAGANRAACVMHARSQWRRLQSEAFQRGYKDAEWRDAVHAAQRRWDYGVTARLEKPRS